MNVSFKTLLVAQLFCSFIFASTGYAQTVGIVKTLSGNVQIMRAGATVNVVLGDKLFKADKLQTESNSSVGILFNDDTRVGAGPNTAFSIDSYHFDIKSQQGQADISITNGTLALVGGKLTANNLDAIKVHTPTSTLAATCSTLSVKVDPIFKEVP